MCFEKIHQRNSRFVVCLVSIIIILQKKIKGGLLTNKIIGDLLLLQDVTVEHLKSLVNFLLLFVFQLFLISINETKNTKVLKLPELNRTILMDLMKLCRELIRNETQTKMNAKAIAIALAGTMLPIHFVNSISVGTAYVLFCLFNLAEF